MNRAKTFLLSVVCFMVTQQTPAQSLFEATLKWSDPALSSQIAGKAFFMIQDAPLSGDGSYVNVYQIMLADPLGQSSSLDPVFQILSGGSLPFSLDPSFGRHFTLNDFSWDYEPLLGYYPFDLNASEQMHPFSGTSFRLSFDGPSGLENQLVSQGGIFQITMNGTGNPAFDNSTISGQLLLVQVPEPSPTSLAVIGGGVMVIFENFRRRRHHGPYIQR